MRTEEIWKDVKGYEGRYQVSNHGRVKSFLRGGLILSLQTKNGYSNVNLFDNNRKMTTKTVHRLVAIAFIPNPDNKPQVNHIDYNRKNNYISNLEWNTVQENSLHSFDNYIEHSLSELKKINDNGENKNPILMMDRMGNLLKEFSSMSEASLEMCGKVTATISNHIRDRVTRKTAHGHVWAYKEI